VSVGETPSTPRDMSCPREPAASGILCDCRPLHRRVPQAQTGASRNASYAAGVMDGRPFGGVARTCRHLVSSRGRGMCDHRLDGRARIRAGPGTRPLIPSRSSLAGASHGIPHYTEVATYEAVRTLSKKLGVID